MNLSTSQENREKFEHSYRHYKKTQKQFAYIIGNDRFSIFERGFSVSYEEAIKILQEKSLNLLVNQALHLRFSGVSLTLQDDYLLSEVFSYVNSFFPRVGG